MRQLFVLVLILLLTSSTFAYTLPSSNQNSITVELGQPDDYSFLYLDGQFYSADYYTIKSNSYLGTFYVEISLC